MNYSVFKVRKEPACGDTVTFIEEKTSRGIKINITRGNQIKVYVGSFEKLIKNVTKRKRCKF